MSKRAHVRSGSESSDLRLANLVGALSLALGDRLRQATEAAAGETGAAPAALVALREFLGGRSMDELRRAVGLTPSGAVRLVDRLVAEGMVVRSDGTLVLTDAGHTAAERLFEARREGLRELLADWSPEEYAELGELLTKLSRAMLGADADRNLIDSAGQEKPRGS